MKSGLFVTMWFENFMKENKMSQVASEEGDVYLLGFERRCSIRATEATSGTDF